MILITGATGFIGQHVVKQFLKKVSAENIRVLLFESEREFLGKFPGIRAVFGELFDKNKLGKALDKVDTVIHLASKNIDNDGTGFHAVNVQGTEFLCQQAVQAGIKKIIYISSVGVYGHKIHRGIDETTPVQPDTGFSRSKAAAENIILQHHYKKDFEGIILRHRFVYGEGDEHVIARMVKAAKKYKFLISGGRAKLSLILVNELAEIIFRFAAVKTLYDDNPIYHVTDGVPIRYRDIISSICEAYNFKPPKMSVPFWLLYTPIRFIERIKKRDPENTNSSVSSLRLQLIGRDNYFSNEKLLNLFPDLKLTPFKEAFKNLSGYYSIFK
ncbi:MAG: NAD-dependent epimerase/dehydratase family protein [Candidatus Aminicenantes bacterium]|nr:MAG: NAD-dependent epimerase/dehydratase family protein [Candidatus Aminicenantes bacterium]